MIPITSIYIPFVNKDITAEFIANVIEKNGLAKVKCIAIEPYKSTYVSIVKNDMNQYNRVYISIKTWEDTEAAFNFIQRLRNPNREARLVFEDDDWWHVEINNEQDKLLADKNTGRVVTLFSEENDSSKLTIQLKSILAGFKRKEDIESEMVFQSYIHEMDEERSLWFSEQFIYDALNM